jgi:hypothetical protein
MNIIQYESQSQGNKIKFSLCFIEFYYFIRICLMSFKKLHEFGKYSKITFS